MEAEILLAKRTHPRSQRKSESLARSIETGKSLNIANNPRVRAILARNAKSWHSEPRGALIAANVNLPCQRAVPSLRTMAMAS